MCARAITSSDAQGERVDVEEHLKNSHVFFIISKKGSLED